MTVWYSYVYSNGPYVYAQSWYSKKGFLGTAVYDTNITDPNPNPNPTINVFDSMYYVRPSFLSPSYSMVVAQTLGHMADPHPPSPLRLERLAWANGHMTKGK